MMRNPWENLENLLQCGAPKIAKLVPITPICLWFMVLTIVFMGFINQQTSLGGPKSPTILRVPGRDPRHGDDHHGLPRLLGSSDGLQQLQLAIRLGTWRPPTALVDGKKERQVQKYLGMSGNGVYPNEIAI